MGVNGCCIHMWIPLCINDYLCLYVWKTKEDIRYPTVLLHNKHSYPSNKFRIQIIWRLLTVWILDILYNLYLQQNPMYLPTEFKFYDKYWVDLYFNFYAKFRIVHSGGGPLSTLVITLKLPSLAIFCHIYFIIFSNLCIKLRSWSK